MNLQFKQSFLAAPFFFKQNTIILSSFIAGSAITVHTNSKQDKECAQNIEDEQVIKQKGMYEFLHKLDESGANLRFAIQLISEDGKSFKKCIAPSFSSSFAEAYIGLEINDDSTISAYAAYKKKPIIVEAIRFAAIPEKWRLHYTENDIAACYSFPIFTPERKLLAMLTCYHNRTERIEMEMIDVITKTCAFAAMLIEKGNPEPNFL